MTEKVPVARKLGSLLIEAGLVTEAQIAAALEEQRRSGRKLGQALVDLGFTTETAVREALANQLNVSRSDTSALSPEPEAIARIPAVLARECRAVPLELHHDEGVLIMLMEEPGDLAAVDRLELAAKLFVQPLKLESGPLRELLDRVYGEAPAAGAAAPRRKRVGELLVEAGVVDDARLAIALAEQKRTGGQLGQILVQLGLASEEAVSHALADQTGVAHSNLDAIEAHPMAISLVPEAVARKRNVAALSVDRREGTLRVAMANPSDIVAIDELEMLTGLFVQVSQASVRQISRFIDRAYASHGGTAVADRTLEALIRQAGTELQAADETPTRGAIAALVDELISSGIRKDATDVHFEPDRNVVRVRYRIDGDLVQGPTLSHALLASIVARVKILAQLDIAVTRTPQDGKIGFPFENRKIDLRVSTFPAITGESVVVRVLDTGKAQLTLDNLGLAPHEGKLLRSAVMRPNGLILAVGPTGSGKTTTLYALLRAVDSSARKVITLEDPVEYELSLVTQCQINEKAGVTFAGGLRAILRHDPDIVLVGEMRDTETCQMAMRASLTGHLVLSTLHTNDAVRSISRLRDMGVEPYLLASCLSAVCAQRLIRMICTRCRSPHAPTTAELEVAGFALDDPGPFFRGQGCERCHGTGIRGRKALYEVMQVTPEISHLIARSAAIDELERAARGAGMQTFRDNASRLVREGMISLAEAARVALEA